MNNIDNFIYKVCENDVEIPNKIENRVKYTLRNKNKIRKPNYFRKFVTVTAGILCIMLGSIGVYAAAGGTIEGIPMTDWLGIKFSNKYVDYKKPVENQVVSFENTSVELSSTLCSEGITILEFNLKLSEDDYKKLKLNENIITDEYLEKMENSKNSIPDRVTRDLQNEKYNEEMKKGNFDFNYEDVDTSAPDYKAEYDKRVAEKEKELEASIEERRNTSFIPALSLNYNQKGGTYNYDKFNPNMDWYASMYVDDTPYYVRNWESIEKVSDYEYKIYVMYFLDEDILDGKESFKITLKNNKIVSLVNWKNLQGWRNDCQNFASNLDSRMMSTPETVALDVPIDFEVTVSKSDILKDSKVLENLNIKSEFRNITQTVEKVVVSPLQTIVKINHSATKQSSKAFANRYDDPNIEHLPMTRQYKVYDANGHELECFSSTNKNTLIYEDGTREDYDYHDIPNKKYDNATWERVEYLLIENTDTDYIKIVPVEVVRNPVDEDDDFGEIDYEMEPLIINLK